jgi:hypothetical protein
MKSVSVTTERFLSHFLGMDIPVPAGHIEETDGKVLEWSRRKSEENQSKALNRRWIDKQLSPLIGLLIGLQIAWLACAERLGTERTRVTYSGAPYEFRLRKRTTLSGKSTYLRPLLRC